MKPLIGFDSEENSYLVDDYPYGYTLRTQARFWLEKSETKGFRFCSQTLNPKNNRWNNPKKSTYCKIAACMYLDDKEHVVWSGLSEYDDGDKALEFITKFPEADTSVVKTWAIMKTVYLQKMISGAAGFTMNGIRQETTEADKERYSKQLECWKQVIELIKG